MPFGYGFLTIIPVTSQPKVSVAKVHFFARVSCATQRRHAAGEAMTIAGHGALEDVVCFTMCGDGRDVFQAGVS